LSTDILFYRHFFNRHFGIQAYCQQTFGPTQRLIYSILAFVTIILLTTVAKSVGEMSVGQKAFGQKFAEPIFFFFYRNSFFDKSFFS
jgi:hypothetical protein